MSKEIRTGDVKVAGVRSPFLESGPVAAKEAVVFVHGNPGSSEDWRMLLKQVGSFGRGVALDMPGFGQADKPKDFNYTIDGYARHLTGALEQLGIDRAHLVLHDFGGPWGMAWAAANPSKVASISLINIGILPGYRWHYLARIWRTPVFGELFMASANRAAFGLLFRHGNPRGLPKHFLDRMFRDFDAGTKRAVLQLYRATSDLSGVAKLFHQALYPLDLPALVIWGKHDPYLPVRYANAQKETFPKAEVVVLEDSGHWPFADDPDGVAAVLMPFLRRQH